MDNNFLLNVDPADLTVTVPRNWDVLEEPVEYTYTPPDDDWLEDEEPMTGWRGHLAYILGRIGMWFTRISWVLAAHD